jgi:hypothetical protein
LERVVRGAPRAKPERALQHVRLEDRLDRQLQRGLHDTITNRRDRQRSLLLPAGLRYEHPPRRQRPPPSPLQIRGQLVKQPLNTVLLDISDSGPVDAGRAPIGAHLPPRPLQDVAAEDLVIERVKPSPGIALAAR